MVGRVVAHGGDTVEITEDAQLSVNGSTVIENDIYYSTPRYESGIAYPVTLAKMKSLYYVITGKVRRTADISDQ